MLPLCLIVSADSGYVAALQCAFRAHGVKLHGARDMASVRSLLTQWRFDAVLCDGGGPGAEGLDATLRTLRRAQRGPIVVLVSSFDEDALITSLEAGATELVARTASPRLIALKLRRLVDLALDASDAEPRAVSLGGLKLDPRKAEAVFADRTLPLTGGEFELLLLLATRSDSFVHRDTIVRTLGRKGGGTPGRCADMHVCRIRRKLKAAGASSLALETVYGRGYALRLRGDGPTQFMNTVSFAP